SFTRDSSGPALGEKFAWFQKRDQPAASTADRLKKPRLQRGNIHRYRFFAAWLDLDDLSNPVHKKANEFVPVLDDENAAVGARGAFFETKNQTRVEQSDDPA